MTRCDDVRLLVRLVAVAGRGLPHPVLAAATNLPEKALLAAAREAVDRRLLVPAGEAYDLRHPSVHRAVLADTLPGERIRLHRLLADALAAHVSEGDRAGWAELAGHRLAAHDVDNAVSALLRAGLAAERRTDRAAAREHFEHAVDLSRGASFGGDTSAAGVGELYLHAAEASHLNGDVEHAIALAREGIERAAAPVPRALLLERYGRYLCCAAAPEELIIDVCRRAADLVSGTSGPARARVLAGLAHALLLGQRHAESGAVCGQALRVARDAGAGARGPRGHALCTLGAHLILGGDPQAGIAHLRHALAIAMELDDADDMHRAYTALSDALRSTGQFVESEAVAREGLATARLHGVESAAGAPLLGNVLDAAFLMGRWDDVAARLPGGGAGGPATATVCRLAGARLWTARGRFADADRWLRVARRALARGGSRMSRMRAAIEMAELELWRGRPAHAVSLIEAVGDVLDGAADEPLGARALALMARGLADLAILGRRPRSLAKYADRVIGAPAGTSRLPETSAYLALARAELSRTEPTRTELSRTEGRGGDPVAWVEAATAWERLGCPYQRAYAMWRAAEALPARDTAGVHAMDAAAALAARLGATALLRAIRASAAGRVDPGRRDTPAGRRVLTPRELEVLELLAAGHTNREIAGTLHISAKTVGIHVSRILEKLGVSNRTAAAAAARDRGLLTAPAPGWATDQEPGGPRDLLRVV